MPSSNWLPNLFPGAGYDSLLGEAKQQGVEGELTEQIGATGQDGDTSFHTVETSAEFDAELGIGSELKVGFGAFGGNAKFAFKDRNKVSNQSTFCIIRVFALNSYQSIRRPKLAPDAWQLLANKNTTRFRERFGDFFISGQRTGVEFFGVLRIEADTVQKQKEIAASIQASYGLAVSGQASLSFKDQMSSAHHEIEASTFQKGGRIALAITLDELVNQARAALDQSRAGQGFPFAMELDSYSELELPNDDAHPIDVAAARDNIEAMAVHTQEFRRMQNDIEFVLRHQSWFEAPDVAALNAVNRHIAQQLEELRRRAKQCATKFSECQYYAPEYPELILPPRKAGAPPMPTIRVPDLRGWRAWDLEFIWETTFGTTHQVYTVEEWVAGKYETDQGQPAVHRPREIVEFCASGITFRVDEAPGYDPQAFNIVVGQSPVPGTMVSPGDIIVLMASYN